MTLEGLSRGNYGVASSPSPFYPAVLSFFLLLDFPLFSQFLSFTGYPDILGFYRVFTSFPELENIVNSQFL